MTLKRWIEQTDDADELTRAVLRSGLDADPPPSAERAVWQGLSVALGMPPVPGGPGGASPSGGASSAASGSGAALKGASTLVTLGKGFALGVGVSLVVAGAGRFERVPSAPTVTTVSPRGAVSAAVPGRPAPVLVNPLPELPRTETLALPSEGESVGVGARPSAHAAPPRADSAPGDGALPVSRVAGVGSVAAFPLLDAAASPKSRLEEEAALLRSARSELQAGKLAEAFATLEASREKFSAPELSQEREALLIELLYRSGQRASAAAKAESFLLRFPGSPHGAKVRSFAAPR